MTINFGPCCTCGQPQWSTAPLPCPLHGYYAYPNTSTTTWTSITRVCEGRHCAHDDECNRFVTWNSSSDYRQ